MKNNKFVWEKGDVEIQEPEVPKKTKEESGKEQKEAD